MKALIVDSCETMMQRCGVPFVALVGLLPFVLAACTDATSSTDPRTQPPLVRVVAVKKTTSSERSLTGIVAARVQSDLGFRVSGQVLGGMADTVQNVMLGARHVRFVSKV